MNRDDFLEDVDVKDFTEWLSKVISGEECIEFIHNAKDSSYRTLHEAFNSYAWPMGRQSEEIPIPNLAPIRLSADADFDANKILLDQMSAGLKDSLSASPDDLVGWIRAIMVWGGVYKEGNKAWLNEHKNHLQGILRDTSEEFKGICDGITVPDFRFNSAMTKVYALLLDDFVIYDSRVAAALAWLVLLRKKENPTSIPGLLKFGCMPANEPPNRIKNNLHKIRSPNKVNFPHLARGKSFSYKLAMWNLRANWILKAAFGMTIKEAQKNKKELKFKSLREIEAALFVMGYDLRHAI